MASKIQIRRGTKSQLPTGAVGEPLYTTDTNELYIGTSSGNVNMTGTKQYMGTDMSDTSGDNSYVACPLVKLGDTYLNTSNGNLYECTTAGSGTNAKWTYRGCLKGATGSAGQTGAAGANGKDGTSAAWHTGTEISGTGTQSHSVSGAHAGDMYLNTSTCDVYKASSESSWEWQCNIKGEQKKLYSGANEEIIELGKMDILGTEYTKLRWAYKGKAEDNTFFTVDDQGRWKCNKNLTNHSDIISSTKFMIIQNATLSIFDGEMDSIYRYINGLDGSSWSVFTDISFRLGSCEYLSVIEFAVPSANITQ